MGLKKEEKKSITIITPLSLPDDILKSVKNGSFLGRKEYRKSSAKMLTSSRQ